MLKKSLLPLLVILLIVGFATSGFRLSKGILQVTSDTATAPNREKLFNQYCSGCHNFRQDAIGPQLAGITSKVSVAWLQNFIKDPQKVIKSEDERGQQLYKKYKVFMPSFASLKNEELGAIISFIGTHNLPVKKAIVKTGKELTNPIPEPIKTSGLVVGIQQITQIPASSENGKFPLARVSKLDYQPNTKELFILDLRGKLYRLKNNQPEVYMDMAKLKSKFINQPGLATGFGSFAFHPDFAKNGLIYTTHSEPPGSAKADFGYADSIKVTLQWVVTEWKANNPAAPVFTGKGRELFRVNMVSGIHGVQEVTFNPLAKRGSDDFGLLYIGIGDGGAVENDYAFLAHSREKVWGTVLRINPTARTDANGRYGIPATNPFAQSKNTKTRREIYAYGFRNPHRITWSKKGEMLVSNVGHANIESLNLIEKGHDYGWPIREGTFLLNPYGDLNWIYPLPANDNNFHITYPVAQYDHDEGKAISGGFEYTGSLAPELKGKFLFGDIPTGRLFYLEMNDIKQGKQAPIKEWKFALNGQQKAFAEICPDKRIDLHFGKDAQGELYMMTKSDGKVYKMVSAENTSTVKR